ncbi:MAG: BlaI/MecI/CopY family transcriptional regulator [Pseudomonadota bacterium]
MPSPFPSPNLGELEIAVMDHVWATGEVTAKAAHEALGEERGITLNTVQSTLERLHRKQLLKRAKRSHAYAYSARVTREELVGGLFNEVLARFGGDPDTSMAAFVDAAERLSDDVLEALEAELRNRRGGGQ